MAYQEQTTLAGPDVVINNLMTFAAANGWTVERNDLVGSNRTATLRKAGVTDYIHVYNTDTTAIRMRISIGYDGGLPPASQPNVSGENVTTLFAGPYPTCFFFASQDQVWVAVAIALSGEYRHFTFGRLEKAGVYTGGTYVDGTSWPVDSYAQNFSFKHIPFLGAYKTNAAYGRIRADIPDDSRANWFHEIGATSSLESRVYGETGETGDGTAATLVNRADRNAFSGRTILHAIPLYVRRIGSALYYSPMGVVQDVRYCSINKFEPEQELTIGSDTWKLFPVAAKRPIVSSSAGGPAASGDYAFAIKKVS
jgi:hypothetical protein